MAGQEGESPSFPDIQEKAAVAVLPRSVISFLSSGVGVLNCRDEARHLQVLNLRLERVLTCYQKVISSFPFFVFLSPKNPPSNSGEMIRENVQFTP